MEKLEERILELEKQNVIKNRLIFIMFFLFLTLTFSSLWLGYNNLVAVTALLNK